MEPYFCYIHRDAKPVAELKVLTPDSEAGLELELARLRIDYPQSRFEIFQGDRLVATLANNPTDTDTVSLTNG